MFGATVDMVEVARRVSESIDDEIEDTVDLTPSMFEFDFRPTLDVAPDYFAYLTQRGLGRAVVEHFRLGWSHGQQAIVQPYFDDGLVAAIKYRYLGGRQQFAFGSKRIIYNVDEVRGVPDVVICEGESDTHAVWQHLRDSGIGVGGIPGASSRPEAWELRALDLLFAKRIFIAFDADTAGDDGAATAMKVLGDRAIRLRPPVKDWSLAIRQGLGHLLEGGLT
jgi:DNA primase